MGKSYKFNLSKRYKVTFIKDTALFKKDEETEVGMAVAAQLVKEGKINATPELLADAKKLECEDAFSVEKKVK